MFSKQVSVPLWRQLTGHRRPRIHRIYSQIVSSQQSVVTLTTPIPSVKQDDKEKRNLDHVQVRGNKISFGSDQYMALQERIYMAGLEDLKTMSLQTNSLAEISLILARLNQLNKEDKFDSELLISNDNLKVLGESLHKQAAYLSPKILVSCLQSLLDMHQTDIFLIQSLEQETLWLLPRLTVNSLVEIAKVHEHHQETPLRKKIYSKTMLALKNRWVEITNPKDLITLMYLFEKNSNDFFSKLEERALDLSEEMNPKHLQKILYLLSRRRQRNTPLIRSLAYHLNKGNFSLSLNQLTNLMFACSRLNIHDTTLLEKITTGLKKQISLADDPRTVCSLLTSTAVLRWRHPELIEKFVDMLENIIDKLSSKEKAGIVISLAKLNYKSQQAKNIVKKILSGDLTSLQVEVPSIWLDFVWSLAVLNLLDSNMAASTLNPSFVAKVQVGSDFQIQLANTKLANINTSTQVDISDYSGPQLSSDVMVNGAQLVRRSDRRLAESVVEALTNMAPKDRFVKTNIDLPSGYFIDAELFVDQSGEPKPYQESINSQNNHRVCIKVLDYPDMTLFSVVPIGLQEMSTRHLSAIGYKVVEIPYLDMQDKLSIVKKVQYLQNRLREAVTGAASKTS